MKDPNDLPSAAGPPLEEPTHGLFLRLASEIEPLLAGFALSEQEAEEVLRELLGLLLCDWERLSSRELWLIASLRRACQRQVLRRSARLPSAPAS